MMEPRLTFDTNLAGIWQSRVLWGTLCEETGQKLVLVPTAAGETLRRIRLETEREWMKKLKAASREQGLDRSRTEIRRLAVRASQAARDWLREEVRRQGSAYVVAPEAGMAVAEREEEIEEALDDRAFDLTTDNGIRDRKIVVEAMARDYDILASNNVESIDHGMLRDWIERGEGRSLGVSTTILRPAMAEERLRVAHGKPIEWTAYAAARSCVTDPYDVGRAARELCELIEPLHRRGMAEVKERIRRMTEHRSELARLLEHVAKHGRSVAGRAEGRLAEAVTRSVQRDAGGEP